MSSRAFPVILHRHHPFSLHLKARTPERLHSNRFLRRMHVQSTTARNQTARLPPRLPVWSQRWRMCRARRRLSKARRLCSPPLRLTALRRTRGPSVRPSAGGARTWRRSGRPSRGARCSHSTAPRPTSLYAVAVQPPARVPRTRTRTRTRTTNSAPHSSTRSLSRSRRRLIPRNTHRTACSTIWSQRPPRSEHRLPPRRKSFRGITKFAQISLIINSLL